MEEKGFEVWTTPHRKYLEIMDGVVGLRGKRILEVGGCTPAQLVAPYQPVRWHCVNLDLSAVEKYNAELAGQHSGGFSAGAVDILDFGETECYDRVYSINAFEHIHDLEGALERMFNALIPGGYLFALFGPIWSSDFGHHLSIPTPDGRGLHFYENVLLPWEHLTSSRDALWSRLEGLYGAETASRAVTYIYEYPDLNRLYESDYLSLIAHSNFSEALILRNRHGVAPNIEGASSTRELLIVLKKGGLYSLEKPLTMARFAYSYLKQKLGDRNAQRNAD
jgi:SAM-dependent methyltransferase